MVGVENFSAHPTMETSEEVLHFCTAMKHLDVLISLLFIGTLLLGGCDSAQPRNKGKGEQPVVKNDPPPVEAPPAQPEQQVPAQNENNMVLVNAAPGMSGKGNYGTPTGNNPMEIITVPISTMFKTKDRLVLMNIDHAMNLYRAEHGQIPASHVEFMENIIRANMIQLPQLPAGQEYVYDPSDGVLKIQKPKNAP